MHYIKCAVNSSLLTQFWLLQDCGTLNTCFITTHSIHKEGDLQIYFCVVFRQTRHYAQAHITSGALCLFLTVKSTQTAAHLCGWFRWPVLVMATPESRNIFCAQTWSSNQSGGGRSCLFPASSFKFITRMSLKSWISLASACYGDFCWALLLLLLLFLFLFF